MSERKKFSFQHLFRPQIERGKSLPGGSGFGGFEVGDFLMKKGGWRICGRERAASLSQRTRVYESNSSLASFRRSCYLVRTAILSLRRKRRSSKGGEKIRVSAPTQALKRSIANYQCYSFIQDGGGERFDREKKGVSEILLAEIFRSSEGRKSGEAFSI